jgi:RNA polymerase sigma-70 factor (ECF subfamily)
MKKRETEIREIFRFNKEEAFKKMFDLYYSPLCEYAAFYTDHYSEAEDLVQKIFMRFWIEEWQEKIHSSIGSFLKVSVRNSCRNYTRDKSQKNKKLISKADVDQSEQVFDFLIDREERAFVKKAISSLPPKAKIAFELVYLENESYKSAANNMSVSVNTLKSHLKNALSLLREDIALKKYYFQKKTKG